MDALSAVDFKALGQGLDLDLLRGVALGGKRSGELQLLLDSQASAATADYQALALAVANLSVPEEDARRTFQALRDHQVRLGAALGRPVGLKAAALDLVEALEQALQIEDEASQPSYWQLEQMAYRDPLTGARNFRFFSGRLPEELQRAKRYRHQLSLVMLDIDHFKKFNDTHGHTTGDAVLKGVAAVLAEEARNTDVVCRYGGEEMAVILPETDREGALRLAERFRRRIADRVFTDAEGRGSLNVTISVGVALFEPSITKRSILIERADEALYAAKHGGRNRVEVWAPAQPESATA